MTRRLDFGQAGDVSVTPQCKDEHGRWRRTDRAQLARRWRAHARLRTWDGLIEHVDAFAPTRKEAERACEARIVERLRIATADVRPSTPLSEACRTYLDWLGRPGTSTADRTLYDYNRSYANVIEPDPGFGQLRLDVANDTQRLRRFLQAVADRRGTGTAARVKSILSGLMRFAVNNGVLDSNNVRHVGRICATEPHQSARDHTRAMTRAERDAVIVLAYELATDPLGNPRSVRRRCTVADQVAFLAGTGVRIDESRILRWTDLEHDWTRATIRGTKTVNSHRILTLPVWLTNCLAERFERESTRPDYDFDPAGYVFAAPGPLHNRTKWEASNNSGAVRCLLDAAGLDFAVPHTFRRTVATLLDREGVPLARIADQLGHDDPAMTMTRYLGRDFRGDKADLAIHL